MHAAECCMSGCAICVYDLYQEALESYQSSIDTLRYALDDLNVPEYDRPFRIQRHQSDAPQLKNSERDVIMNAFEAFEKSLQKKRAAQGES